MPSSTEKDRPRTSRLELADFLVLATLHVDAEDLAELAHQGFISSEHRGAKTYFKLRYRKRGKQQVRIIGDAEQARALQLELNVLQRGRELRRRGAALTRKANTMLRAYRQQLQPIFEAKNFYFHGHHLRKRRKKTQSN